MTDHAQHAAGFDDHARAVRVARRDALFAALMDATGTSPDDAAVTEPITVVRRTDSRAGWLSAG